MDKILDLKNVVWQEGKYYIARCLNVEVASFGKTREQALKNLNEALKLYFEDVETDKIKEVKDVKLVGLSLGYA
jgi:predicted RNase H-like HicB family nuclease